MFSFLKKTKINDNDTTISNDKANMFSTITKQLLDLINHTPNDNDHYIHIDNDLLELNEFFKQCEQNKNLKQLQYPLTSKQTHQLCIALNLTRDKYPMLDTDLIKVQPVIFNIYTRSKIFNEPKNIFIYYNKTTKSFNLNILSLLSFIQYLLQYQTSNPKDTQPNLHWEAQNKTQPIYRIDSFEFFAYLADQLYAYYVDSITMLLRTSLHIGAALHTQTKAIQELTNIITLCLTNSLKLYDITFTEPINYDMIQADKKIYLSHQKQNLEKYIESLDKQNSLIPELQKIINDYNQ